MQAIERIRAALKHLKDVPGSLKTGLGIDEYRAACRPVAMSEVLSHITALEAENERLKDLADSEGSRAVEYLRRARNVEAEVERLRKNADRMREALTFYAQGEHFHFDRAAWDTVSGEPQNYWCDEEGTATVEDGTIAKLAIDAEMKGTP